MRHHQSDRLAATLLAGIAYCFIGSADGQSLTPIIGGIENAASGVAGPLAPHMIASLYGSNLGDSLMGDTCPAEPLPLSCNGTSLLVNGIPVPVFFASSTRIRFQVPNDINGNSANIQVRRGTSGQSLSNIYTAPVASTNPGLNTTTTGNTTIGAFGMIQTVILDPPTCALFGSCLSYLVVAITDSTPAHPGDRVFIGGTGFGATSSDITSGNPSPSGVKLINKVNLTVSGQQVDDVVATPSLAGEDPLSFTVPSIPTSGLAPVVVSVGTASSPAVLLPISVLQPSITRVTNSAGGGRSIASGSWVSIYGTDLSATTRAWQCYDFSGIDLPLSLDGVHVTINGRAAAVSFISPTQVNIQSPDDTAIGPVEVRVTNASKSTTQTAMLQSYAPGLFTFQGKYVAAVHSDGSFVAPAGYLGGTGFSRPAKAGEVILVFGTGFGPTSPPVPAGKTFSGAAPLTDVSQVHCWIGNLPAEVQFAGLVAPGEYQFNVIVPAVADGDQLISAEVGGLASQLDLMIPIRK